jgi:F0F1-type ATP synthase epsilon subunit
VVTVLTNRAIPMIEIRAEAVKREVEQAQARRATTDVEQAEKTKAVTRARAQLRIAGHEG